MKSKTRRLDALQKRSQDLRAEIRTTKQTLIADGRVPSAVAIRQRIIAEERTEKLIRLDERFTALVSGFEQLAVRWKTLQARKKDLAGDLLTPSDKLKLNKLQELVLEMERQFQFRSFPPESITISRENYLPTRQGFDLVYDISASDNVRTISAYLFALLEMERGGGTNHPGLLMLDEPRQQSLSWGSFTQVLGRAKSTAEAGQQIILATSEEDPRAIEFLTQDKMISVVSFPEKVLQRIEDDLNK